jgi:hypothetical protein
MPNTSANLLRIVTKRIAKLAKVPTDNQGECRDRIYESVLRLRKRDRRSTGERSRARLLEVADAARRLQDAFFRINKRDRSWIELIKQSEFQFEAARIHDPGTTILNITLLLHAAAGKSPPPPPSNSVFAKRHKRRDPMLRELVFCLLSATANAGGKLSFNKNSANGTLADALGLLRDHLPNGLVPDPLPSATIQRLKAEFLSFESL